MAWGVFKFSKEGRQRLAGVLRVLLIAQLIVSLCMVIFCYNTSLKVMSLLKDIHQVTVFLVYGLILFQAYCMKLHYTGGFRLLTLLMQSPYWPRVTLVNKVWLVNGTMIAANGMLVYAACRGTLKTLMKELSSSLRIGISQYLSEPKWKKLMDTMQVELSCCGADEPSNWHEIPWLNMDFLNEESDLVLNLASADGKVLPPVSPYSCCSPRVLTPCYHDPLQQLEWRSVWSAGSALVPASLHTCGCVEAVRAPLTRALLALHCFSMLICLLQIAIVVLTQLLLSSTRAAVLTGTCDGEGVGCLLPSAGAGQVVLQRPSSSAQDLRLCSSHTCARRRRRRPLRVASASYPCLS